MEIRRKKDSAEDLRLHVEDRKQKKNFTEEELSITSTSALSFLPLPLSFPWQTDGLHQPLSYPVP